MLANLMSFFLLGLIHVLTGARVLPFGPIVFGPLALMGYAQVATYSIAS